ncbi:MAG: hypothetical protein IKA87_07735 [Lentisphaeria bacterium]|nr:hypothetical protein [Lentisphaeria bacterium]
MNVSREIAAAAELDRSGFLPLPGESFSGFINRFKLSEESFAAFEQELAEHGSARMFDEFEVTPAERIAPEIMKEAAGKTMALYKFENRRVPGFFLSGKVGALWGGCMIGDPDNGFAVMLLRSEFRNRAKWYVYERQELIAHELCHAMRQSLNDSRLEEYFAYQTSGSFLRRHLGNCFVRELDAILFIFPTLILLGATLTRELSRLYFPLWPFWIFAAIYPLFLLLRNFSGVRAVKKAEKNLKKFGITEVSPVLFRCTFDELKILGKLRNREEFEEYRLRMQEKELRWAIMGIRFFDQKGNTP